MSIERFKELFVHRADVFAEQQPDGTYRPVKRELTDYELEEHFAGVATYGVYVVRPTDQTVKFVCFDLDTKSPDAYASMDDALADLRVRTDRADDVTFLYERSGNKGYHFWLFFDQPVEAARVRAWLDQSFAWDWKSWPELEIFPKQDRVNEGGYGNLVKLPLGKHQVTGNFSEFVGYPPGLEAVVDVVALSTDALASVRVGDTEPQGGRGDWAGRGDARQPGSPFPCVNHIMRSGVKKGHRDQAMFHLALYLFGHGIDKDLALEICRRANAEFEPPLREDELRQKLDSAYSGRYASATCGRGWLADICPGPCKGGLHVRQASDGALLGASPGDLVELEVAETDRGGGRVRLRLAHPDAQNSPTIVLRSHQP